MQSTLDNIWDNIKNECSNLKQLSPGVLGCRFLYSPSSTFSENNGLLVVGMNPGMEVDMIDRPYPERDCNAFLWETWSANRQYQNRVKNFLVRLAVSLGEADVHGFINRTVTSNFLPFRSKGNKDLGLARQPANAFAHRLWLSQLAPLRTRVIVSFGSPARDGFKRVLAELREPHRPTLFPFRHSRCKPIADSEIELVSAALRHTLR